MGKRKKIKRGEVLNEAGVCVRVIRLCAFSVGESKIYARSGPIKQYLEAAKAKGETRKR